MSELFPTSAEPVLAGPAPRGLGRMVSGGGDKVHRRPNDFYPTPRSVTLALLAQERHAIGTACAQAMGCPVWEPCGRGGAIAGVLQEAGLLTVASDVVADPEHDVAPLNLLLAKRALSPVVVTNPPFAIASDVITHLLERLRVRYLALLLKGSFWHAAERTGLFRHHRPARIYALNWRPDFLGGGNPVMEVMWCVWDERCVGLGTRYDVLAPVSPSAALPGLEGF